MLYFLIFLKKIQNFIAKDGRSAGVSDWDVLANHSREFLLRK